MVTDDSKAEQPDWKGRAQIALSLVNHRGPSERVAELMQLALNGASVEDLLELERMP